MAMTFREKLELLIDANVQGFVSAMDKAGDAADKNLGKDTQGKLDQLAGKFTVMGAAAVGGASVAAIGLGKLATLAGEAQVAQAKLDNSIANSAQNFTDNGAAISDLASEMQKKVAVDDEAIRSSAAVLVQFGLTEDQVKRLVPLTVDLSRKMGVDLDAAAKAVGRSATGSATALKRLGIDVESLGEGATDAEKVISALQKTVGGFATAEGATLAGQITILKNQLSELGESVGVGAAGTLQSIVGGANDLVGALNDVNPGITAAVGSLATLGTLGVGSLGGIAFAAGQLISMRETLAPLTSKLRDAEGALNGFGKAAAGIGAAGAVVAVGFAVVEVGKAFNNATQDAAEFDKAVRQLTGAQAGASQELAAGQAINALTGDLDKASASVGDFSSGLKGELAQGLVGTLPIIGPFANQVLTLNEEFGNSSELIAQVGKGSNALAVDLNQLGESVDKVADAGNLSGLIAFRQSLDDFAPKSQAAREELDAQKSRLDGLIKTQTQASAAQRSVNVEAEQAAKAARTAGLATGEFAATAEDLKDALGELSIVQKRLTAEFDGNQAAAKGFASALGFVTNNAGDIIDSAQAVGKAVNDIFKPTTGKDGEQVAAVIRSLPPEFQALTAATGGYSEAQNKAIDGLQQFGAAAQKQLQTLVSTGATNDQVLQAAQGYADFIRGQLIPAFQAQGLSLDEATAKAEAYVAQLGLTRPQVETQIKLSGVEEARQALQFLQTDLDNLTAQEREAIVNLVRKGDWTGALSLYNSIKDKTVVVDLNIISRGDITQTPLIKGFFPGWSKSRADGAVGLPSFAMGGITEDDDKPEKYAMGGFRGERKPKARGKLPTQAIIQPSVAGGMVQWAEPETKGEAFIPLAPEKRSRSVDIWEETGRRLGVMPQQQPPRLAVSVQSTQMAAPQVDVPPIEVPPIQVPPAPVTQAAQPEASPSISVGAINITEASSGTGTARDVVRKMRDLAFLGA